MAERKKNGGENRRWVQGIMKSSATRDEIPRNSCFCFTSFSPLFCFDFQSVGMMNIEWSLKNVMVWNLGRRGA